MFDVIIVGGGPAGLFLASELRLAGVSPVVLERRSEPDLGDKAHGLAGQSVRLLGHRGLYERCGGKGMPAPAPSFFYAGMPLPLRVLGAENPMHLLRVNQRELERVLAERAAELGVALRRRTELLSFTDRGDQVDVRVQTPSGEETLSARYLVGCDGGGSRVRQQAGIGFPGYTDENIVDRSALVRPTDRFRFVPGGRVVIDGVGEIPAMFHRTSRGIFHLLPHDPERPLVGTSEWESHPVGNSPGPGAPMTLSEMEDSVERVLGVRVPLVPPPDGAPTLLRRLCHRSFRLADRYRSGRVFLAGDAAHVSYGPTLNAAMGDAANLAWKLAAAVKGWAPAGLLDSYERERRATGVRVLLHTQAEAALLAPGANVTALRDLFSEFLRRKENLAELAATMAGADVRYDTSGNAPHALAGWFVPPLDVSGPGSPSERFASALREAKPVLLDRSGEEALAGIARRWSPRVAYVAAAATGATAPAILVRPDGYVAWAGDDPVALESALGRFFGACDAQG